MLQECVPGAAQLEVVCGRALWAVSPGEGCPDLLVCSGAEEQQEVGGSWPVHAWLPASSLGVMAASQAMDPLLENGQMGAAWGLWEPASPCLRSTTCPSSGKRE